MSDNFSFSIIDSLTNLGGLVPTLLYYCLSDSVKTVLGVVGTALSVLTGGKDKEFNQLADLTGKSALVLPLLYVRTMQVINPKFKTSEKSTMGVITSKIARPIFRKAGKSSENDKFFQKHVVSRIAYLSGAIVSTVTRTADLALGILGAALSVITFGAVPKINTFALRHLKSLAVVDDVCKGIRGFVNPQQFRAILTLD